MTVPAKPRRRVDLSDDEILAVIRARPWGVHTCVIRNVLAMEHPDRLGTIRTSSVRDRLKRMERAGLVTRAPTISALHLCWIPA